MGRAGERGPAGELTGYHLQYRVGSSSAWTAGPQGVAGTGATIADLAAGTAYEVQVRAVNDEGTGPWSEAGDGLIASSPVFADAVATRSMAETVGGSEAASRPVGAPVAATDADGDTLGYSLEGADAAAFAIDAASGQISTRTDRGYSFEERSGYAVTVRASDGAASATVAVAIGVTDVDEPPLAPTAPAVVTTIGTTDSLDVRWIAPDNAGRPAITGYEVQYREAGAGTWEDGPQGVAGTGATITRLAPGTAYEVQVRAVNADGDGEWSDAGAGGTNSATNAAPVFADAVPTRSMAETVGGGNEAASRPVDAPVTATDADTGATLGYSLIGSGASFFSIDSTTGQMSTRTDRVYSFEERSGYAVTVRASDGTASATVVVTIEVTDVDEPPRSPVALTVVTTAGSTTSLDVSWRAPENAGRPAITGYDLQYRVGNSRVWTDGPKSVAGTGATIVDLAAGTAYEVQVRAANAEGDGAWSDAGGGSTNTTSNAIPTFANSAETRNLAETEDEGYEAMARNVGPRVAATDADPGDTVSYSLLGIDAAAFAIDRWTGQILTKTDRRYSVEEQERYSITVKASDGTASSAVPVTIKTVERQADATPGPPRVASLVRRSPAASPTNADRLTWRVSFNEDVRRVDATDFQLDGTTATLEVAAVVGSSARYDVTASGGDLGNADAKVTLSFASVQDITDAAGNDLASTVPTGANHNSFVIDNIAPGVESIVRQSPASSPTNADSLTWRVTLSEDVTGVDAADFRVSGTTATLVVAAAGGSSARYDVTASGGDLGNLDATVKLSFSGGSNIADRASNALADTAPTGTDESSYAVDTAAPGVASIMRQSPASSPTNAGSLTWRVTFSEDVTGVDAADFRVSGTTATLVVAAAGGSSGRYDVTASGGDLEDLEATVTLSFASSQDIADALGNALAYTAPTGTDESSYTVDNIAPGVESIVRQSPVSLADERGQPDLAGDLQRGRDGRGRGGLQSCRYDRDVGRCRGRQLVGPVRRDGFRGRSGEP